MSAALLHLIATQPYPDPRAQPLAQRNDLWRIALLLADLCPGIRVVGVQAEGSGLEPLDENRVITASIAAGSDQCFLDMHALIHQGWALTHIGVFPEVQLPVRAIEHMRNQIAKDELRCLKAGALIHPDEMPELSDPDEEEARWLAAIRSQVEAHCLAHASALPVSPRNAPRL